MSTPFLLCQAFPFVEVGIRLHIRRMQAPRSYLLMFTAIHCQVSKAKLQQQIVSEALLYALLAFAVCHWLHNFKRSFYPPIPITSMMVSQLRNIIDQGYPIVAAY